MNFEQIFLANLPHLKKAIEHACKRYKFRKEECEDFYSSVMLKIIEDDYGVLRKFQGKSSLPTYLTVVVNRFMLDYQNRIWGKWRPSAEAKRLGQVAIRLDTLLFRDQLPFDQACEILRTNEKVELTWQELLVIAVRLPSRSHHRIEGEDKIPDLPAKGSGADAGIQEQERQNLRRKAFQAIGRGLAALPDDDRLLLRESLDLKVSEIARTRELDQKALYRRLDNIKKVLREELERSGIRKQDIDEILGEGEN